MVITIQHKAYIVHLETDLEHLVNLIAALHCFEV